VALAALLLTLWSAAAAWYFYSRGYTYYYGDAEAHLNIARRITDSRTPGYDQVGTVWLPLPHWLMMPLARRDALWESGVAGVIPSAACFVVGAVFLFAATRRLFGAPAATAATALAALNPNLMYLQSTPMTEAVFFAALMALLYFTCRYRDTQGWGALAGAGLAALAGTLTRYEGWFLLPFVAAYILLVSKSRRAARAAFFCVLAGLGPLYWLGHNWWIEGDPLAFWRGPFSAWAIQRGQSYPGHDNWAQAWLYYRTAVELCAGQPLFWMGAAGVVAALVRRAWWAVALLALPGAFYVWSLHSSSTPIYVPPLWPHTFYNTRYGLALLPLLAAGAGAIATLAPRRARLAAAALVVAAGAAPWILYPRPASWVTWNESRVNSEARRAWTRQAADFLRSRYTPGAGIATTFSDLAGIFRQASIPLRETLTNDQSVTWQAACRRPELFLHEDWAVATGGDDVQTAVWRLPRFGRHYALESTIIVKGAPVVEIYRH
jgi:hypothetical protein